MDKMLKCITNIYYNLKKKLIFTFKKRSTLKNIYAPIIQEKINQNKILISELKELEKINFRLNKEKNQFKLQNNQLKNKIKILQELIINKTD